MPLSSPAASPARDEQRATGNERRATRVAVTRLILQHFRNYRFAALECDARPAVLTGHNGAGKTNLLEAVSLFSPGRGMRGAALGEMTRRGGEESSLRWSVAVELERGGERCLLGTGLEAEGERRAVRIDGDGANQAALGEWLAVIWLTPGMSQLFTEGHTARRRFLDRLVYGFDPAHAARISGYEHHMRERNRLLASPYPDRAWLAVLERRMAESSVAVAAARLASLDHLNEAFAEADPAFPIARMAVDGDAETALAAGVQAVAAEDAIAAQLEAMRPRDAASGRSGAGAHKSRLGVWLPAKETEAGQCSTGEQKALLISILLAQARALERWRGMTPLLLLDEVVAHLDRARRAALFSELGRLALQAWMTGTDAADFSEMGEGAQRFLVQDGIVAPL